MGARSYPVWCTLSRRLPVHGQTPAGTAALEHHEQAVPEVVQNVGARPVQNRVFAADRSLLLVSATFVHFFL